MKQFTTFTATLFSMVLSSVMAVPPPSKDIIEKENIEVPESALSIVNEQVEKNSGGEKLAKGAVLTRKVRDIEKLPPVSMPAPLAQDGTFGTHRAAFIMVEFKDRKFPKNMGKSYYEKMIFSKSGKSLRNFYREISYGKFDVTGDVYGIVQIDEPVLNYHYKPGKSFGLANMKKLVQTILAKTRGKINWAKYDVYDEGGKKKPDNVIDHFGIIYPGGYDDIWPHRWGGTTMGAISGYQVKGYFIQNTTSKMGTFIHEFGHDLGLPDLYDTDYSSYGIGKWGTMALGSWGDGGRTPIQFSAWSKMKMGWLKPTLVTKTTHNLKLKTSSKYPVALKIPIGSVASKEYFLVENRTRHGYDKFVPNTGILIWHVDERKNSNANEVHKLLDVVEATPPRDLDGKFNKHFPRYTHTYKKGGKDFFGPGTDPSSNTYAGAKTGIEIKVKSGPGDVMTLDIKRPAIANPKGKLVTLDYDNYKNGQYWFFNFDSRYMNEAMVKFTPRGGATIYALNAGIYYKGSGSNNAAIRFKVYQARGSQPGKLLYTSKEIYPDVSSTSRMSMISHPISKKNGLKTNSDFFVAVQSDNARLGIISTRPGSRHSAYRPRGARLRARNDYNYVIRAEAVTRGGKTAGILASKNDRVVKKVARANRLRDRKKYKKAKRLYESSLNKMLKNKYKYQEYIAPTTNSLGVLAYRTKDYKLAIKAFQVSLQMAEYARAETQQALIHQNLGETWYQSGQYNNALQNIEKALQLKKKIPVSDHLMVDSLIWMGKTLKKLGRSSEAREYLNQGLKMATQIQDSEHIQMAQAEL